MATAEQLENALRKADAAGDTEGAKILAAELRRMRAQTPSEIPARRGLGEDIAGELTRAAVPYVAATGVGAAMGGPYGAVAAPLALAGGDILVGGVYNPLARLTGLPTAPTPSEAFQSTAERIGIGARGQSPISRTIGAITQGALGGGGAAISSRGLSAVAESPVVRNVLQQMAVLPKTQIAAGMGAAGAPQVAQELGVTDPTALATIGAVGGLAAGRLATPKPPLRTPTQDALERETNAAYAKIDESGVAFKPQAAQSLATNIRNFLQESRFNARRHEKLAAAFSELEDAATQAVKTGKAITLKEMDVLRGVLKDAAGSYKRQERKLALDASNLFDDFIKNTIPTSVNDDLLKARALNTKLARSRDIQQAIDAAALSDRPIATALRSQFRSLANPKSGKIRTFEPEQQEAIKALAKGTKTQNMLLELAKLEPSLNLRGLATGSALTALGMTTHPYIAGGLAVAGKTARVLSNKLAEQQAARTAAMMRGGPYVRDWRGQPIPQALVPVSAIGLPQ